MKHYNTRLIHYLPVAIAYIIPATLFSYAVAWNYFVIDLAGLKSFLSFLGPTSIQIIGWLTVFVLFICCSRLSLSSSVPILNATRLTKAQLIAISVAIFWSATLCHISSSFNCRPTDYLGDEDYHYNAIADALVRVHSLAYPLTQPGYFSLRYPQTAHSIYGLFGTADCSYRNGLVILYLLATLWVSICIHLTLKRDNVFEAILINIAAVSPLQAGFTSYLYLDLVIPAIVIVILLCVHRFELTSDRSALDSALLLACVLPLIKQSMATSFLCFIAFYFWNFKRERYPFLFSRLILVAFPICFLIAQAHAIDIDRGRLNLSNIFLQEYWKLFVMAPIYMPGVVFVLCDFVRRKRFCLSPSVLLAGSIFTVQLLLYAIFEPGWMPWSRNFLALEGVVVFVSVLFASDCVFKNRGWTTAASLIVVPLCFASLISYQRETSNFFYGEIESAFDYANIKMAQPMIELKSRPTILYTFSNHALPLKQIFGKAFGSEIVVEIKQGYSNGDGGQRFIEIKQNEYNCERNHLVYINPSDTLVLQSMTNWVYDGVVFNQKAFSVVSVDNDLRTSAKAHLVLLAPSMLCLSKK